MIAERLAGLSAAHGLPVAAAPRLAALLDLVAAEPASITAVRDPAVAVDAHVADSLAGLGVPEVRGARRVADLGSGAGFPGLVLAIALPAAAVTLVESVTRKAAFLRSAIDRLGLENAEVVLARAEDWPEGMGVHDLVTARALAALPVLLEYAAPLLARDGALVAWKATVGEAEEADGRAAAQLLGMSGPRRASVQPFPGARDRSLYVSLKVSSTPNRFPRRPGMASKRPLRASTRG